MTADSITQSWLRNESDRKAVLSGCRFDPKRGAYAVWWIERYLRLYEGEWAGEPVLMRGCQACEYDLRPSWEYDEFDDAALETALERARRYAECHAAGHTLDWQYECVMRIFGWVRPSERWKRNIRRFREAFIITAKKNKKSPQSAAIALFLMAADDEQGQKVFLCAKDGTQARDIVGKHTVEMMRRSPELSSECRLNMNLLQITHTPTSSILLPLSSSNANTQESKEGLNGSVIIDEVHVVDRAFVRRISRMGISRSEPLRLEVTTAGNDPDGYGYERFCYARRVESGEVEDQGLFVAIYAAPQDVTDEQLDADPVKYGRMANPAWGHTVDPEEYLEDYRKSKQKGIQELLDFKMYRLNVWQRSSNPWLRESDWAACHGSFTEDDLEGKECWSGLDLSRTRDLSALVHVFRGKKDDEYLLLPRFWLPRERFAWLAEKVPEFHDWKRRGFVSVTPGAVTDFGYIQTQFRKDAKKFRIQELAYDPHFAEETTQQMSEGLTDDAGKTIMAGTGVPRFLFQQSDNNFAAPTADFERLVIAHTLHHDGNPLLAWQAQHAHVMVRQNKVKRVVKATKDDYRTVDGVVSAIMALGRAVAAVSSDENWYVPGMFTGKA